MSASSPGYDAVLLDLDGTVLRGSEPVPGAPEAIEELRRSGTAVQFITNNASRGPEQVAEHLTGLGIHIAAEEVLTSGQAAVALLESQLPAGAAVLVVGTEALVAALRTAGLKPVTSATEHPAAVLQGHSPDTGWTRLAEACLAIRAGAVWGACNIDRTLPTERGLLPGNGAMVAALRTATDREPAVAGKPERPLLDTAMKRIGARRPLVVGDRLDTDIAGACAAGLESLLVLSGVADAAGLLAAGPEQRPVHVGADIGALREKLERTRIRPHPGWRVDIDDGSVLLHSDGTGADPLDALRTLCAVWWAQQGGPTQVRAGDECAGAALKALGLVPDRS